MEKLILSNFQAPGDAVMLTAAVRDLHRSYSLIRESNFVPYHFLHGFVRDLSNKFGRKIRLPACLLKEAAGVWKDEWVVHEQMPVELIPV